MTYLKNLFAKWRAAFVRARAGWISRRLMRKVVKGGMVEVVDGRVTSAKAISNYNDGREIDETFFTTPDDRAELDAETYAREHMTAGEIAAVLRDPLIHSGNADAPIPGYETKSTIELRWDCEAKMGANFQGSSIAGRFMQRPDESGIAYRLRLLKALKS